MKLFSIVIIVVGLFLTACADPAANKPKAVVSNSGNVVSNSQNVSNANTNNTASLTGDALAITPASSKIAFTGSKVTGSHDGGFKQFTGTIQLVNAKPEESGVSVEIDMNSVYSDQDGLTEHLKSPDFFDVAKFPKASFKSLMIATDSAKVADNYSVIGDFEIRGVKKSITFPATIKISDSEVSVDAEFSINRKDFGIAYAGKADDLIRDAVVIKLNLKSPRKK